MSKELKTIIINAIRREQERAITEALKGTTSANPLAPSAKELSMHDLLNAEEKVRRITEKPYRDLLSRNGFDPDHDMIILPKAYCNAHGFTEHHVPPSMRRRVKFSNAVTKALLIRNMLPCFGL